MEDGFIFCDTPPIKNTDRISLHLDIDGKLFKTKRPLYFHEPFKVSNITPSVVSPAQHVHLTISGISCKDWMQYFVRFQTANGTKKIQQGICRDSVVSCFVPEFPPNTLLRVGLTLSNRLVEWSDTKILIQYPVDAMKSSVDDITTDFTKEGAFRFVVVLKDRFNNPIKVIQRINKNPTPISVQYSSKAKPQLLRFLRCTTTVRNNGAGDEYVLSCEGSEKEDIFFYPSMNNVPLGGKDKYEAKTTLCPGKNSCKAQPKSFLLVTVLACLGTALLVSLVAVLFFVRYKAARKRRFTPETTTGLEMEVQPPENEDRMRFYDPENNASANSDEEETAARTTKEDAYADNSSGLKLGDSGAPEESERDHQTDVLEEVGSMHQRSFEKGDQNYVQSKDEIEMKGMQVRQFENDSELSSDEDFRESARSSPLPEALLCGDPCGDTMAVTSVSSSSEDIDALACTGDGSNVPPCQEQCMDKIRKQTAERRKYRPGKNKVLSMECEPVTPGQTKYTDRFKKADHYRQAWIENLLGEDE
ncbi:uncharacterized protein [Montipora foliosa]